MLVNGHFQENPDKTVPERLHSGLYWN